MFRVGLWCFLGLFSLCIQAAPQFLPPDQAFRAKAEVLDGQTIGIRFEIARGYYLYRDKFRVDTEEKGVQFGSLLMPPGKEKEDGNFGRVSVFYNEVRLQVPVTRAPNAPASLSFTVVSQGCAEGGICYPPEETLLSVALPPVGGAPTSGVASSGVASLGAVAPPMMSETSRIAALLSQGIGLATLAFFGFGLLLSFTPCVLPMVPILSSIIVNTGGQARVSSARGFMLSLAYVLGMAVTYTLAGVAAGLTGTLLSTVLQNPWVIGGVALFFVVLAGSMFGIYSVELPLFLQTRLSRQASQYATGHFLHLALMGGVSALVVGPCVAAPLAGALLYIGQTGDALLGGVALFSMALGMGVPLLLIGASAGRLLPKMGAWMEGVKHCFGFILLGTAVWLVSPHLPLWAEFSLWGVLFFLSGGLLGRHCLSSLGARRHAYGLISLLFFTAGGLLLSHAYVGREASPLLRFARVLGFSTEAPATLPFEPLDSLPALNTILAVTDRPIMLDFYADWCIPCRDMERLTFSDRAVQEKLKAYRLLRIDMTRITPEHKRLLQHFGLFGPPAILFLNRGGQEIAAMRTIGYQEAPQFLVTLNAGGGLVDRP